MDVPLVTLMVEDEWNSIADAIAKFKLAPNYARSSWDWIGLYKVNLSAHVTQPIILCIAIFNQDIKRL